MNLFRSNRIRKILSQALAPAIREKGVPLEPPRRRVKHGSRTNDASSSARPPSTPATTGASRWPSGPGCGSELFALDVGDIFAPNGTPKTRVWISRETAKRRRAADLFLPDRLVRKLRRFWRYKNERGQSLEPSAPLLCSQSGLRFPSGACSPCDGVAAQGRLRSTQPLARTTALHAPQRSRTPMAPALARLPRSARNGWTRSRGWP